MMLDRNNKSLNIANVINNNINDEINKYQFTLDVPTEIETQKDMEDVLKNKHRIATSPLRPHLLSAKELNKIKRLKETK